MPWGIRFVLFMELPTTLTICCLEFDFRNFVALAWWTYRTNRYVLDCTMCFICCTSSSHVIIYPSVTAIHSRNSAHIPYRSLEMATAGQCIYFEWWAGTWLWVWFIVLQRPRRLKKYFVQQNLHGISHWWKGQWLVYKAQLVQAMSLE